MEDHKSKSRGAAKIIFDGGFFDKVPKIRKGQVVICNEFGEGLNMIKIYCRNSQGNLHNKNVKKK